MNPEDLLTCLLAALRPALPAETALTLGAFTEEDWQQLLALADDHRVGPLLYQQLCLQGGWDQLPAVARQRLQQRYDAQAWHNLCLYHNLHTLLTAFQARQIPTILLKGAHLAATVYDQIALRPMMDIDLLVPFDALQEAIAAIQQKVKAMLILPTAIMALPCEPWVWQMRQGSANITGVEKTGPWYQATVYPMQIASATAVWYHTGKPPVPIRWVLLRDPQQRYQPLALLCTNQQPAYSQHDPVSGTSVNCSAVTPLGSRVTR